VKKGLPEIIREIRERMSLNQREFGLMVFPEISENAAQNKIKRFEQGAQEPVLSEIVMLAKAMNVSIPYLFGEDEDKSRFDPSTMCVLEDANFVLTNGSKAQQTALVTDIMVLSQAIKENLCLRKEIESLTNENQQLKNIAAPAIIELPDDPGR